MKNNHWYDIKAQSLAVYVRNCGYDLAVFDEYPTNVQRVIRKVAVEEAVKAIKLECQTRHGIQLDEINKGVYVIALSNPMSMRYGKGRSQIIYIGMGNIVSRIKSHFENSLFDFMLSVNGANFDFRFARPGLQGGTTYYKHVEFLMLQEFEQKYGGLSEARCYPLLNKNAGSNQQYTGGTTWWKKPLSPVGRKPKWELKPTDHSEFKALD